MILILIITYIFNDSEPSNINSRDYDINNILHHIINASKLLHQKMIDKNPYMRLDCNEILNKMPLWRVNNNNNNNFDLFKDCNLKCVLDNCDEEYMKTYIFRLIKQYIIIFAINVKFTQLLAADIILVNVKTTIYARFASRILMFI